ncbi:response regulator [Lacrimispora brassicae]
MKILIVDDERMICEWLQFCIQSYPGCELSGCAHNGEQALSVFKEKGADIVFTDIKMPLMGGLELLREIKKLDPRTIVILLTAFADFDLVREAIRQGGDDYLLKTEMNQQSFQEMLSRLELQITRKGSEEVRGETESTGQQHSIISDILRKDGPLKEEDIRQLRECNIRWRDGGLFSIAVWKQDLMKDFVLPQNSYVRHVASFEYDRYTYVMIGNLARDLTELKKNQILYEYASAIVLNNGCMAGVSAITEHLSSVSDAIVQAVYGLGQGYYEGKIKVWQAAVNGSVFREKESKWESVFRKKKRELYDVQSNEFYGKTEETMEEARKDTGVPISGFTAFCCDAMELAYMRFAEEDAQLMHHMLLEEKCRVHETTDYAQARYRVLEFIRNVLAYQDVDERRLSKGVAAAVDYVRKHYSEPISLEMVSQKVHLNSEYLSRIFKEEVGCTYSAFISEIRLKKAAYLLSHTTERVQKIGESVGYPNVSYFSTTFKKRYGVNPYEYRRGE